ncbi:hypothetical protein B296_00040780 [Ensete ventricosum]|uniref:Uncharacterized protein n=1 Tax=Ensete ventricosum TaxID=4639 RepID=A0A426Z2P8_ENSVE|nr:hypothetical protein B296_00040780 [Ensete ventricosum]
MLVEDRSEDRFRALQTKDQLQGRRIALGDGRREGAISKRERRRGKQGGEASEERSNLGGRSGRRSAGEGDPAIPSSQRATSNSPFFLSPSLSLFYFLFLFGLR